MWYEAYHIKMKTVLFKKGEGYIIQKYLGHKSQRKTVEMF